MSSSGTSALVAVRCRRWASRSARERSSSGASGPATGSRPTRRSPTSPPTRSTSRSPPRPAAGSRGSSPSRARPSPSATDGRDRYRRQAGRSAPGRALRRAGTDAAASARGRPVALLFAGRPADRRRARGRPRPGRGHRRRRPGAEEGPARLRRGGNGQAKEASRFCTRSRRTSPSRAGAAGGRRADRRAPRADVADAPAIAKHMLESRRTAAHCTTIVEVDMSRVARDGRSSRRRWPAGAWAHLPRVRRRATVEALAEHPIAQRVDRRRGDRLPRRRQPRDRGRARRRADRPGDPEGAAAQPRGARRRDRRPRRPGASEAARARRGPRRDVHDHQPRPVRSGARDADHQPAPGRDPRPRGDRQAAGRRRRAGRTTPSRSGR